MSQPLPTREGGPLSRTRTSLVCELAVYTQPSASAPTLTAPDTLVGHAHGCSTVLHRSVVGLGSGVRKSPPNSVSLRLTRNLSTQGVLGYEPPRIHYHLHLTLARRTESPPPFQIARSVEYQLE